MRSFLFAVLLSLSNLLIQTHGFAQVLVLSGTTDSLTINIAGAATTTNPIYSVVYRDGNGFGDAVGATTGATPVTPIAGNAAGPRIVESVRVRNADSVTQTITVANLQGATSYTLVAVPLQTGESFYWNSQQGIRVIDANGQFKQAIAQGSLTSTQSIGASTAAAGSTTTDAGVLPAGTASTYPTTAANGTTGVRVNAADQVTGRLLLIGNGVSNAILKVYAPSGGTINGAAADAAFSSVSGKGVIIQCLSASANTWLAW